jgi:hypothetical protein
MKWIKAPKKLTPTIQALMRGVDCQNRLIFGYPAYFINGNTLAFLQSPTKQATLPGNRGPRAKRKAYRLFFCSSLNFR